MARIGEILIQKGLITADQLKMVIEESKKRREVIGKTLVRLKLLTEAQLLEVLGDQLGLPFYPTLKDLEIPQKVIDSVPVKFVWHYKFMPIKIVGKRLTIAISDPLAVWSMEDLKLHLGYDIERVLAVEEEIMSSIRKHYGFGADTVEKILEKTEDEKKGKEEEQKQDKVEEIEEIEKSASEASVIRLVNQILSEAISARATDVHIEPYRNKVRVRYRIDGILYDINVSEQIRFLLQAIVSRIKILSNLNVVEKRLPQDGRAIVKLHNKQIDLRISVIPSLYGESVVIRILPTHLLFDLAELGFFPEDLRIMADIMKKTHGIIFLTGPTGSGKTTTLYACLSKLNRDSVKIITLEDPIEYELGGITQIQIRPEIGFTFANALRSLLRHDPDIMMIGEVRDLETAELAIRTALTGHLIFSTLHTNDAASGATRLLDIGLEPYLVASSVNAFISQRLVRIICPECKEEDKRRESLPAFAKGIKVYHGKGCDACKNIGYQGRTTIYEIFPVVPEIQELILKKVSSSQIKEKAVQLGLRSLQDTGMEKVKQGITTISEVLRVTKVE
jgi:type II secretory ATPase GspE/PulE/Tfp pilus assembly ATPase PilB-like protein